MKFSMRRVLFLVVIVILAVQSIAIAEIPYNAVDSLSKSEKHKLLSFIDTVISKKEHGYDSSSYHSALGMDLMDLSIDELNQMRQYMKDSMDGTPAPTASAPEYKPTVRRNAFEFDELCMKRLYNYNEKLPEDERIDFSPMNYVHISLISEDRIMRGVTTAFAGIDIDLNDFSVARCLLTFMDLNETDSKKSTETMMKLILALSALETDDIEDGLIQSQYQYGISSDYYNAIDKAQHIVFDNIYPQIKESMNDIIFSKKQPLLYSGNYDWSVQYQEGRSGKYKYLYLVAESRD